MSEMFQILITGLALLGLFYILVLILYLLNSKEERTINIKHELAGILAFLVTLIIILPFFT